MADPQTTASSTSTDDNELSGLLNQSFNNPLMKDYVGVKAKAAMLQQGADVKKAEILEQTQKPFIEQELAKRKELEPQQADIRAQMSKPFQIPQPMMADFASLGGMLAVTASMLGGAGKQPAMQAMAAMTGILDGYQKGRKDLINNSFKEFDANMKRLQSLQKAIDDELANYVAQMKAGKEGAALSAQTLIARTSGGSYAAAIMNQSADKTLEIGMQAQRLAAQRQDALSRINAEQDREDRKNVVVNPQTGEQGYVSSRDGKFHKLDVPEGYITQKKYESMQTEAAKKPEVVIINNKPMRWDAAKKDYVPLTVGGEEAESFARPGTPPKPTGLNLPKDSKTNDEHRFRFEAMENVKEVLNDLKDPKIRKLIGPSNQYWPDIILNLQDKFPELAQKLARFQSQEFQIGGKSLTQSEQRILGPIYNWRNLTAKALEDNLREANRIMNREQGILESRFDGLKEVAKGYAQSVQEQPFRQTTGAPPAPVVTDPNAIQAERAALTERLQKVTDPEIAKQYKERFKLRTGQDY